MSPRQLGLLLPQALGRRAQWTLHRMGTCMLFLPFQSCGQWRRSDRLLPLLQFRRAHPQALCPRCRATSLLASSNGSEQRHLLWPPTRMGCWPLTLGRAPASRPSDLPWRVLQRQIAWMPLIPLPQQRHPCWRRPPSLPRQRSFQAMGLLPSCRPAPLRRLRLLQPLHLQKAPAPQLEEPGRLLWHRRHRGSVCSGRRAQAFFF